MVLFALKERIHKDEENRVQYEAAKSLVLIGMVVFFVNICHQASYSHSIGSSFQIAITNICKLFNMV